MHTKFKYIYIYILQLLKLKMQKLGKILFPTHEFQIQKQQQKSNQNFTTPRL